MNKPELKVQLNLFKKKSHNLLRPTISITTRGDAIITECDQKERDKKKTLAFIIELIRENPKNHHCEH